MRIIIAGFGGQGILLIGQLLARIAMRQGKHVTWLPSYGPEMRGGTAHCSIVISEKEIDSPVVEEADALVAFNMPSLRRFSSLVLPGGTVLFNASMIEKPLLPADVQFLGIPLADLANQLGNPKVQNMIMLGAFLQITGIAVLDEAREVVREALGEYKSGMVETNCHALTKGAQFSQNYW